MLIEVETEDGVDRADEQGGEGELGEVLLLVGHAGHPPSLQGCHFFIGVKNIFKFESNSLNMFSFYRS